MPDLVHRSPPGFRFSRTDAVVLILAAIATPLGWKLAGQLSLIIPFVVLHFFLFCNVFRVRRSYELAWAAAFLAIFAFSSLCTSLSVPTVLLLQLPVTLLFIVLEFQSPRYHGIAHARLRRRTP